MDVGAENEGIVEGNAEVGIFEGFDELGRCDGSETSKAHKINLYSCAQ